MKEILLVGNGGHSKSVIDVIEQEGRFKITGVVGKANSVGTSVLANKVIGDDSNIQSFSKIYTYAIVAVGQIHSPEIRIKLFDLLLKSGFTLPSIISPRAYVSKHAIIGNGTIIMHDAIVNSNAVIGDNCIINSKALIEHDSIIHNHCHISTNATINGGVIVGEGSFIGSGAIVTNSITIKKNSFVKAGELVK
jgi:sugar O-acyltransferase (sialic acid O-acetyltransferase NeuD family)